MKKITKKIASLALSLSLTLTSLNFVSSSEALAETKLMTPLVINEIVPDTDNVDGSDGYEFFEIQNVSNKDINIDDYNIVYNNNTNWSLNDSGIILSPGENLVVWIKNDKNTSLTYDDFNTYYETELVQGKNLTTVSSGGFHNSKQRDLSIVTDTGDVLSSVRYNEDDVKKVEKDNGINFRYLSKGQLAENLGYSTKASPGLTNDDQKYETLYEFIENENGSITVENAKTKLPFNESFEALITQDYTDLPLSVTLELKGEGEENPNYYPASIDSEGKFFVSVPFADLTNYKSFDWKVIVKTDSNQYETETKTTIMQDGELDRSKFPPFVVSELIPDTD